MSLFTAWNNFKRPLHRQFPEHYRPITWRSYPGHGLDGIVFKGSIGEMTYVIKVVRATNLLFFHGQYLGLTWDLSFGMHGLQLSRHTRDTQPGTDHFRENVIL